MTLLAFVMMILAAQLHGSQMAMAEPDHAPAQMQTHGTHASTPQQCTDHGSCHSSKDLCDFVCSGLSNTILTEADGAALFQPVSTLARMPRGEALDGISPALDQRPPIALFA